MATLPTLDEVLEYLDYAGLGIEAQHVPSVLGKLVTARVSGFIDEYDVSFNSLDELADPKNYIWGAGLCLFLEFLSMRGQVHWNTGDVAEQRVGEVTTKYQRWSPMFFFAQGHSPNFYALLPHDSYRMMSYELVRKWAKSNFKAENPNEVMFGTIAAYYNMTSNTWEVKRPGSLHG
jgi:hypothetical protein